MTRVGPDLRTESPNPLYGGSERCSTEIGQQVRSFQPAASAALTSTTSCGNGI
jgi:hypothetical protein